MQNKRKSEESKVRIGEFEIGKEVFIIGEAGVNHNGSLQKAKELVDIAKKAGVNCVKFQTWKTEELMIPQAPGWDIAKSLELKYSEFIELKKYCDELEIMFLSTPDEETSLDFLVQLGVPAIKVGSGELTNIPFLNKIAQKGLPIILSTGMGDIKEVQEAVDAITQAGNQELILLHCTTAYPTAMKDANLKAIKTMKEIFNLPTGFSDHTQGVSASFAAVILGATVIEKHFTYSKLAPGPDHKASLEPEELAELVRTIREAESLMGSEEKKPVPAESENRINARKSIRAKRFLNAGEIIRMDDLTFKRPGNGMSPSKAYSLVGLKLNKDRERDMLIREEDVIYEGRNIFTADDFLGE